MPVEGDPGYEEMKEHLILKELYDEEIGVIHTGVATICSEMRNMKVYGNVLFSLSLKQLKLHLATLEKKNDEESESFKDNSKSPIFSVTFPRRQVIREKVRKRGLENAERMPNGKG